MARNMSQLEVLPLLRKKSPNGRAKVKSGCRTCKIRKIKCDESRPTCFRCASTGRICDGYGIWGGGERASTDAPQTCIPIPWHSIFSASMEEKGHFDWFRCRTTKKLSGPFASSFWDTLVLQACSNEPAVLHAILAITSFHKADNSQRKILGSRLDVPDEEEQFMLRQYSKAIGHLQPHFSANDRDSVQVALVTCVVFICLEFLRGHFRTAQTYLRNGLKMLSESHYYSEPAGDGIFISTASRGLINDEIIEAFVRLRTQVELFPSGDQQPQPTIQAPKHELPALEFQSMNHARHYMDHHLEDIVHLIGMCRQRSTSSVIPLELLDRQKCIRIDLAYWLTIYQISSTKIQAQVHIRDRLAYKLLRNYHTMADIMADSCFPSTRQQILDSHENDFISIINQMINLFETGRETSDALLNGNHSDMSRFMSDIALIPPLYYTAINCRTHQIRLQAIKLLELTSHREGIWDAKIAACVARRVMEMEERDFYNDYTTAGLPFRGSYKAQDFSLPTLPMLYRIDEVRVVLPDDPLEKVIILCRKRQEDGSWEVMESEYDAFTQSWTDKEGVHCNSAM